MFRGKKYQESAKQIDKNALYDTNEAMELLVKTAPAKFDETVEPVSYTHLQLQFPSNFYNMNFISRTFHNSKHSFLNIFTTFTAKTPFLRGFPASL